MGCLIFLLLVTGSLGFAQNSNPLKFVKGGTIQIGSNEYADIQPEFKARIQSFWMQEHEVTNQEFANFVEQTNYVTLAEKNGGSYVFDSKRKTDSLTLENAPWWYFSKTANWKNPYGKDTVIGNFMELPVVHISHQDASCYCNWLGMRLPTEIEREYVGRKNGTSQNRNTWQGDFPSSNLLEDGFELLAPVKSYDKGQLGLYDIQGNVWEWCMDPYHQNAYQYVRNWKVNSTQPLVPNYFDEFSPTEPTYVIRGGSFLCSNNYCEGFKASKRMRSSSQTTFQHIGFRCVK